MLAKGKLLRNVLIMNMDMQLEDISKSMYGKEISALNAEQIYIVVVRMVKGLVDTFIKNLGEKKFYYISTAFKKGGFLENNLINLGIYDILEGVLASKGQEMSLLKEVEKEYIGGANSFEQTSKGFFMECNRYGLSAEAMGIRSIKKYGTEEQETSRYEAEKSWLIKQDYSREIFFDNVKAKILFYNLDVVGREKEIYQFHLYDLEIQNEVPEEKQQIYYEYFLVNCSVWQILQEMRNKQYDLRKMDSYVNIGMEGKYVAFVMPELVRVMVNEKAIPIEEAIKVVRKTCGYSDLTAMVEAVKQCPIEYTEKLVPGFVETIEKLIPEKSHT